MTNLIVAESKNVKHNGVRAVNDAMRAGLNIKKPFRVHRERVGGQEVFIFEQHLQS